MATSQKSIFQDLSPSLDFSINPYAKILASNKEEQGLPIVYGSDLKGKAGHWRSYFERSKFHGAFPEKLVLEIGCHKGKTLNKMAAQYPDIAFIGMDITFKRVVLTARLALQSDNSNVCALLGDARHVEEVFAVNELDAVIAFFPDPWQKKRSQSHKKLFNREFMKNLAQILKPNGQFWFKTDSKSYFEDLMLSASEAGLVQIDKSWGIIGGEYESTFEAMFKNDNLPTYESLWEKH